MTQPIIEAVDTEFNQNSEFNLQYFEISNYENLPIDSLISILSIFSEQNVKNVEKEEYITLFFYRKKLFSNYDDKIWDAANENEFGGLIGHNKDLIAKVWYKINQDDKIQRIFIYDKNKMIKKSEFRR